MSSKQWTVGYFERENKYSVILDSWLISCGNMRIRRWPKTGNISKMISEYAEYGNDWPTYPVKIISQYYDNYKEASIKERQMFISASASEPEHNVTAKSPVFQKKRTYFKALQNDSDSYKFPKLIYISALNCVDNSTLEEEPSNFIPLNKIQNEQNHQDMVEHIATILVYVKPIDKKLDTIMEVNVSLNIINDDNNLVSLFPITTVEALQNIETKLLDATFEKQMINFIAQIGGLNTHNFTKRVFARVFTNALATQYSWTGFRNNNPLKQLKIITIIKDVCFKTFKVSELEFESNVKNCFKNGSLRQSREKK